MRLTKRFKDFASFVLIITLGIAVQAWAAFQGTASLDGDEAIWGLMGQHILQGQIPTYMYGQNYLGTLEIIAAAWFMQWMGNSVVALRIVSVVLYGGFLVLYAMLVNRWWGKRVALLSLIVIAFPSWRIFWWTFRPFYVFGIMSILGMAALLLFPMNFSQKYWVGCVRWGVFGFMVGLGVWSHPLTLVYFVAVALVSLLQTPEWLGLYRKTQEFCERVVRIPLRELAPGLSLGVFALGVLAFFATDCEPQDTYVKIQMISRVLLLGVGVGLVLIIMGISARRKQWLLGALSWGMGFVVGNLPQWGAWAFYGIAPASGVLPTCPTGIFPRLRLLGEGFLPAIWGIPVLADLFRHSPLQTGLWILMFLVALIALGVFFWTQRLTFWNLVLLSPLSRKEGKTAIWGIVLGLPIVLVLLGGNIGDIYHVRHLLISWQAAIVILALFLARVAKKSRVVGLCLIGLWFVQVGIGNLLEVGQYWHSRRALYAPQAVSTLEDFLVQNHVTGGYADYWTAYPLDFLTEERLVFATYNGLDRCPLYSQRVADFPVKALVLPAGFIPESSHIDDVIGPLTVGTEGGPVFPEILEWLHTQTVVQRHTVANWDVWLLADSP